MLSKQKEIKERKNMRITERHLRKIIRQEMVNEIFGLGGYKFDEKLANKNFKPLQKIIEDHKGISQRGGSLEEIMNSPVKHDAALAKLLVQAYGRDAAEAMIEAIHMCGQTTFGGR